MVSLLVVDMLNVFFLVFIMGFNALSVGVLKTFVFLIRRTPSVFVPMSL